MERCGGCVKIHLSGIEGEMRKDLLEALRAVSCREAKRLQSAQIIFCAWEPERFSEQASQWTGKPVVVVSRLPDVDGWLDALEAGAADYCTPPFEPTQMRWILDSQLHRGIRTAAA